MILNNKKSNLKSSLVAKSVSFSYGDKCILDNISITVNPKDKIALVGLNGSGKSTLLKILVGKEYADSGSVNSGGLKIGYLEQNETLPPNLSVKDYITQSVNCEDKDIQIQKIMPSIDLNLSLDRKLENLSGGEMVKVALIRIIIQNPDILIIDEPTNHLDIFANLWLREFLKKWDKGLLLTSHDRDFLNDIVTQTIELKNGKLTIYGGNYDFYLIQKGIVDDAKRREVIRIEKEIKKGKKQLRREIRRSAHNARKDISRNPDDNDRVRASYFKEKASKSVGKNKLEIDKRLEDLKSELRNLEEKIDKRIDTRLLSTDKGYSGKLLVDIKECVVGYDSVGDILNVKDFQIRFGDRIALFGRNGSGKSTLIKAINKDSSVNVNGLIKCCEGLNIVVLDQHYKIIDRDISVLENMRRYFPYLSLTDIRRHLANFLFSEDSIVNRECIHLSGGEIARLAMSIVTILPVDLLILDEPTNNLDINSIEDIENSLSLFNGSILSVSHDLSFLERIDVDKSYVIKDRRLKYLNSNPSDRDYFKEELLKSL